MYFFKKGDNIFNLKRKLIRTIAFWYYLLDFFLYKVQIPKNLYLK